MPKAMLDLKKAEDLQQVKAQWRFAHGLVPGIPNEGLTAQRAEAPARLVNFDNSDWEICPNIQQRRSKGLTFGWYRITITLPKEIGDLNVAGTHVWFETCVDDYGEIWVDGKCDIAPGVSGKGPISGFNMLQCVLVTNDARPGATHVIPILAVNGPLAQPIGGIFLRYGRLSFEKA